LGFGIVSSTGLKCRRVKIRSCLTILFCWVTVVYGRQQDPRKILFPHSTVPFRLDVTVLNSTYGGLQTAML
jgi:hypothetical protein